ncbi:hypothetical protein C490_08506 [Natronobacterium gregoryi SP2]|uniref:DUF2332 domain-containing protein n=1 Tax=Natronobacterium gregoryi (strain ATCC 43098 / DSM 3393 / CCM 3738 / CIP 104747 / IAM 13177 / JCM 8860 / NBRC 102187 / NCIMB 2189 / SP2) TaxID=797304 RepID=L9Y7Z6_NATGS|nr:hypothetical protein C490_08506 [Natronobacterium gregoryi SP2]
MDEKCPLYAELTEAVADDSQLLEIAAEASPNQPEPELLLAAVQSLLLDGREHPLAQFYPTCDRTGSADDPAAQFRDFCLEHESELRSIVATRRCQTNDVGRSAVLLPAFEYVSRLADGDRLSQIEIGTSAGLNLNWDRYRYDFSGVETVGDDDSPVTITAELRGDRRPPLPRAFPTVVHRRGIDLNTPDVTDEADARWLRALVHPNQAGRRQRLEAAIDVARENRPPLVEGDVLEELPAQLSDAPTDTDLVVFSTHVLYQLEAETIAKLRALLSSRSSDQSVHWLSIDPAEDLGDPTYRIVTFRDGDSVESQVAQFESYGNWVEWDGGHGRRYTGRQ